ncbi:hypothetical protein G6F57_022636 [Rhizopus arrhizus]|nr:hypothetical protein G6F57_022636 [Rhizopus arrhizus]
MSRQSARLGRIMISACRAITRWAWSRFFNASECSGRVLTGGRSTPAVVSPAPALLRTMCATASRSSWQIRPRVTVRSP